MPHFGHIPYSGDGALDLRKILGIVRLMLLLFLLLRSKLSMRRNYTIFFNKLLAVDLSCVPGSQDMEVWLLFYSRSALVARGSAGAGGRSSLQ
jgi:hypothetical protein